MPSGRRPTTAAFSLLLAIAATLSVAVFSSTLLQPWNLLDHALYLPAPGETARPEIDSSHLTFLGPESSSHDQAATWRCILIAGDLWLTLPGSMDATDRAHSDSAKQRITCPLDADTLAGLRSAADQPSLQRQHVAAYLQQAAAGSNAYHTLPLQESADAPCLLDSSLPVQRTAAACLHLITDVDPDRVTSTQSGTTASAAIVHDLTQVDQGELARQCLHLLRVPSQQTGFGAHGDSSSM